MGLNHRICPALCFHIPVTPTPVLPGTDIFNTQTDKSFSISICGTVFLVDLHFILFFSPFFKNVVLRFSLLSLISQIRKNILSQLRR